MVVEDIASVLTAAGMGAFGSAIFAGPESQLPTSGDLVSIVETPGFRPLATHDARRAVRNAGAQIVCRADAAVARQMAETAHSACASVVNQDIDGRRYLSLMPQQEPYPLGVDKAGRARIGFNVIAKFSDA